MRVRVRVGIRQNGGARLDKTASLNTWHVYIRVWVWKGHSASTVRIRVRVRVTVGHGASRVRG